MGSPQSRQQTLDKKSLSSHQKHEPPVRFWCKAATVSILGEPGCLSFKNRAISAQLQPRVYPARSSTLPLQAWVHFLPGRTGFLLWPYRRTKLDTVLERTLLSINGNLLLSAFANNCHGPDAPFIPRLILFVNSAGTKWKPTHLLPALPFSWHFLFYEPRK